jgi:hypothetical protein
MNEITSVRSKHAMRTRIRATSESYDITHCAESVHAWSNFKVHTFAIRACGMFDERSTATNPAVTLTMFAPHLVLFGFRDEFQLPDKTRGCDALYFY